MSEHPQIVDPLALVRERAALDFAPIASFNEHQIGCFHVDEPGPGPWEMHPDTDELLYVLDGSVSVEIHGDEPVRLSTGSFIVVPRGRWHRHVDAHQLVELFFTPGESVHCDDPDDVAPTHEGA